MTKKKILIIGGGGFIGKWLIKSFFLNGWETSIIDPNLKKSRIYPFLIIVLCLYPPKLYSLLLSKSV